MIFINTFYSATKSNILYAQFYPKSARISLANPSEKNILLCTDFKGTKIFEDHFSSTYGFTKIYCLRNFSNNLFINIFRSFKRLIFLKKILKKTDQRYAYIRNCFDFFIFYKFLKMAGVSVIYDVRGLVHEEFAIKKRKNLFYIFVKYIEEFAFKNADFIFTVSNSMAEHLKLKYNLSVSNVIPCTFENDLFPSKSKIQLNLKKSEKDKIIVYSGGASVWQNLQKIIEFFSAIQEKFKDIKFLFLVPKFDKIIVERLLARSNLLPANTLVVSAKHQLVGSYLNMCDYGVIFRDDNIVNSTASPVKIAEYLACGLPVICTGNIGDYSSLILKNKAGIHVKIQELDTKEFSQLIKRDEFYSKNSKNLSKLFSSDVEVKSWRFFFQNVNT